jgi:hypothetical protein
MLLVRAPAGGWSSYVFGQVKDRHTRPIVELDEANGIIHVFATSPASKGTIYEKTTPVDAISFAAGVGTPVIRDADGSVNNATSTKQNVSGSTGLVVAATGGIGRYWHNYLPLPGGGPLRPTASFTASPTGGTAPLTVNFTDTSSGGPTSWAWDFENDGTVDSNAQNPTFTYMSPGSYTVKLEQPDEDELHHGKPVGRNHLAALHANRRQLRQIAVPERERRAGRHHPHIQERHG